LQQKHERKYTPHAHRQREEALTNDPPGVSLREFTASTPGDVGKIVSLLRNETTSGAAPPLFEAVAEILRSVQSGGNHSLLELSRKYDRTSFSDAKELFATKAEMEAAASRLNSQQLGALKKAYAQIRFLARMQMKERFMARKFKTPLGFIVRESYSPLRRIGGYIPGGLASYPSTVLMICGPAREAGVKDIVLSTPPRRDGTVNDATLAAALICGVKEVVKLGGAQAIAALAYGTESIKKVDLIAGPGNQYVTEAKKQVSSLVSIDALAGPTELLIISDRYSDPRIIFEDIISQAEHGNRTLCGVVTDSEDLIRAFKKILREESCGRKRIEQIAQASIFTVKTQNLDQAYEFAQALAPEHLEVQVAVAKQRKQPPIGRLSNSGLVLLGKYAPCSATDYVVGTNHILPTGGLAFRSEGVSVGTFLKRVTVVESDRSSLRRSLKTLAVLAEMEGLPNHHEAARSRFNAPRKEVDPKR